MSFTGPIADRLAIRELYGTYSDTTSRADREGWLACWADDCRWVNRVFDLSGKAALSAQWDGFWQDYRAFAFYAEIGMIAADGERARSRATTQEIVWLKDGTIRKFAGRYEDELVREGGEWRFARRAFTLLIAEPPIPAG